MCAIDSTKDDSTKDDKVTQVCRSPDDTTKNLLFRCPTLSFVLGFDLNLTNFSLAMNPFIIPEITIKQTHNFLVLCVGSS